MPLGCLVVITMANHETIPTTKATMARITAMISAGIAQMMRKAAVSRFTDSSYSRL